MSLSKTSIANMSLARLGSTRITDFDTDQSVPGQQCREHYDQVLETLLRSDYWNFALSRESLVKEVAVPAFGYASQFILPSDYLRINEDAYEDTREFAIEGERILTDESTFDLIYVRRMTDPTKYDRLFVEVFVLQLASVLATSIAQNAALASELDGLARAALAKARAANAKDMQSGARRKTDWLNARFTTTGAE